MNKVAMFSLSAAQALRQFSLALFSLFSAIYIYKISHSLRLVFIFFLIFHTAKFLTAFAAEELALKFGLKKQVYWGQFFLILTIILMQMAARNQGWFLAAAVIWGISAGFYWFGWYGLMVKTGVDGSYGKALGWQEIFNLIPSLFSPILGGVLINFWGYEALFGVAIAVLLLSAFSLFSLPEEKTHYDTNPQEIWQLFKTHKRMVLAYMGNSGAATIYGIVFPLYLYLILQKELAIGKFFSLAVVAVALINFFIGHWVDYYGKKGLVALGAVLSYLIWLGRVLVWGVGWLFFLDVTDRVVERMISLPLEVLSYEKALDGGSTGRAVLFREAATELGAILVCLGLLLITDLRLAFVLASYVALLPLILIKKRGMYGDGNQ